MILDVGFTLGAGRLGNKTWGMLRDSSQRMASSDSCFPCLRTK